MLVVLNAAVKSRGQSDPGASDTRVQTRVSWRLRFGLIDLVSRGEIDRSSNVLLAHLGGQPVISAYAALFS